MPWRPARVRARALVWFALLVAFKAGSEGRQPQASAEGGASIAQAAAAAAAGRVAGAAGGSEPAAGQRVPAVLQPIAAPDGSSARSLLQVPAAAQPAGSGGPLQPEQAPLLQGEASWQPPPAGQQQGQCMVLLQRIASGSPVPSSNPGSTTEACCAACAREPRCTVWLFCPDPNGCNDGDGNVMPAFECNLLHQMVSPFDLQASDLAFSPEGSATIVDSSTGSILQYTVPHTSGFVQRTEPACIPDIPCSHTVVSGDNLSKISTEYGVAPDTLILLNYQLEKPDAIFPGQKLTLPCCPPPAPAPEPLAAPVITPPAPSTSIPVASPPSSSSSGLGAGAIAGIAVGAAAVLGLLAGCVWWRRRRGRMQAQVKVDDPELPKDKLGAPPDSFDTAWRDSGSGSSPPAPTGSTPEIALEGRGSSSAIPELPFASGLLTPADYKIDTDPDTGKPALLGSGHFANVYRGTCGAEPAAIKVIKDPASAGAGSESVWQMLLREVAILKSCRSSHLVAFMGVSMTDTEFAIVTEFLRGGTLFKAIQAKKVTWYRRGARIAMDVAFGLDYLHRRNIVHLDLKSPNVLLTQGGRAKVADVGLARMVPNAQSCLSGTVNLGTFPWAAPEQLLGQRCSTKADIYAFGCVLWEIATAETPFLRGQQRPVKVPEECPEAVADLIAACMAQDPGDRPSAQAIINTLQPLLSAAAGSAAGSRGSMQSKPSTGSDVVVPPQVPPQTSVGSCRGPIMGSDGGGAVGQETSRHVPVTDLVVATPSTAESAAQHIASDLIRSPFG